MDTLRTLIFRPLRTVSEKSSLLETPQFQKPDAAFGLLRRTTWFSSIFDYMKKDIHSDVFLVEGDGFEPSKQDATDLQSAPFGHSGTPPYSIKIVELVMGLEPATC